MMGRGRLQKAGFTLLEIMFAAGVVGLALAFLFGSLITISLASNLTQNRAVAASHISTVMEELHDMGLQQMLVFTPPTFTGLGPAANETVQLQALLPNGTVLLNLPVPDPSAVGTLPNPLLVRCTINWIGAQNRPLTLNASQYFYR